MEGILSGGAAMRRYSSGQRFHAGPLLVLLVFLGVILVLNRLIRPVVVSATVNEAKIRSVNMFNSAVLQEMENKGVTYADLVTVSRDSNGNVEAITADMVKMNLLKASIVNDIQNGINKQGDSLMEIPLGTIIGGTLFHGWGPGVRFHVTLAGNVTADFKSTFESAGVNQTRHQIYITIHASVYSFLPGFDSTTDVDTSMLVAETVIVGSVPEVVANLK